MEKLWPIPRQFSNWCLCYRYHNVFFMGGWDFQQQTVIDAVVEREIALFHSFENASSPFTFGGYMVDIAVLTGEFYKWENGTIK